MTRDAGAPPTWPVAGSGDNATAVGLYSAIVMALYRRERTGKGSYVTTSLLAEGVWSASVSIQAALCEAKFFALHDRKNPANAALNVYRASDGTWFVLIVTPDKLAAVAKAIGRADLLTDPRFTDPAKLIQNMPQLTAILDEVFGSQPMAHWYEVFNGVHVTFGVVHGPQEVVKDPQLRANDIVVPLEGAGGKLKSTISSPIQVHGVAKVPARRAPEIGEHNEEILEQLGFNATEIEGFRTSRAIPGVKHPARGNHGRWTMSEILTERSGSILRIQLNRPEKKNAMTSEHVRDPRGASRCGGEATNRFASCSGTARETRSVRATMWWIS